MTKNVKMLFALLATAAVMVGVSFANVKIDNAADLVAGNEDEAVFTLSNDITLLNDGSDTANVAILQDVSPDAAKITLDLNGHKIEQSPDVDGDGTALLEAKDMSIDIISSGDQGTISMDRPLYGDEGTTERTANILLQNVKYFNRGGDDAVQKAMFIGAQSYDVKVKFEAADVKATKLVSDDKGGYKFDVDGATIIRASLDNVESKDLTVAEGASFSDPKIVEILSDNKTLRAVEEDGLYVVGKRPEPGEALNYEDLKELLESDSKDAKLGGTISATGDLTVNEKKNLDLAGWNIVFEEYASFKLPKSADLTIFGGGEIVALTSADMFILSDGAKLTISGDVVLDSPAMNYISGDVDGVTFKEGAKLWFKTNDDAKKFATYCLAAKGQHLEFVDPAANNALSSLADGEATEEGLYEVKNNQSSGSSVGCNAGFAALALLALAFIPAKKKK